MQAIVLIFEQHDSGRLLEAADHGNSLVTKHWSPSSSRDVFFSIGWLQNLNACSFWLSIVNNDFRDKFDGLIDGEIIALNALFSADERALSQAKFSVEIFIFSISISDWKVLIDW